MVTATYTGGPLAGQTVTQTGNRFATYRSAAGVHIPTERGDRIMRGDRRVYMLRSWWDVETSAWQRTYQWRENQQTGDSIMSNSDKPYARYRQFEADALKALDEVHGSEEDAHWIALAQVYATLAAAAATAAIADPHCPNCCPSA